MSENTKRLKAVLEDWEAVIGLEVHTALTTLATKLLCDCRLSHDDAPNTNVCPVCLGMPGALPVPNKQAVEYTVMAGLATNCAIQRHSMFYRKHYFYPDMCKNYQTTQGPVAFCMHGHLDLEISADGARERPDDTIAKTPNGSYVTPIRILRIHLEEDAAKMVHVGGDEGRIANATRSLIDYNRCGTPLIELVTEPDLRTPEEARRFMEKLRQVFLALDISDCSLEKGSMRCDANVSVHRRGARTLGTKTEMKNLNSLKSLHDALAYEICRQVDILEDGGSVRQETRHWEPSKRRTVVMRAKETADDYRMYPDPDLVPFDLSDEFVERCRSRIPELPDAKRDRYVDTFGLKRADAAYLAADPTVSALFEEAATQASTTRAGAARMVANVVANLVPATRHVTASQVASLSTLLADDAITFAQAREVLELVDGTDQDPRLVVDERCMRQSTNVDALSCVVDDVLARCTDQARQYQAGNHKVVGFLVGQCMHASGGSGNPKLFNQLLRERLASQSDR